MKKNIVAAFVLVFALASCNSQLDDINTNLTQRNIHCRLICLPVR